MSYFFIRYASGMLSEDARNVAVVLFDPIQIESGACIMGSPPCWPELARELDPDDLAVLEAVLADIRHNLENPDTRRGMLKLLKDSFSNQFRVSEHHACFTDNPLMAMEQLLLQS